MSACLCVSCCLAGCLLAVCGPVCLAGWLAVCGPVCMAGWLSGCLSGSLAHELFLYLSACLPAFLFACMSVCRIPLCSVPLSVSGSSLCPSRGRVSVSLSLANSTLRHTLSALKHARRLDRCLMVAVEPRWWVSSQDLSIHPGYTHPRLRREAYLTLPYPTLPHPTLPYPTAPSAIV